MRFNVFFKSKEIRVLRHIFQDYVCSCDYVHTNSKYKEESKNNFLENFWTVIGCFHDNFMILNTVKCHYMCTGENVSDNDLYTTIQKKQVIKNVRLYEKLKTNSMRIKADIIYIKSCKEKELIPTFAKVNFAIKSGGFKIKKKIKKLVMETKIQGKQNHLRKIRKDTRSLTITMK